MRGVISSNTCQIIGLVNKTIGNETIALTPSFPSSKNTFSQLFREKCMSEAARIWQYDHPSFEYVMKSQVLHTVGCDISGETAGEI